MRSILFSGYSYAEETRFKRIRDDLKEQERIRKVSGKKR